MLDLLRDLTVCKEQVQRASEGLPWWTFLRYRRLIEREDAWSAIEMCRLNLEEITVWQHLIAAIYV